jgi:hypothetical protein
VPRAPVPTVPWDRAASGIPHRRLSGEPHTRSRRIPEILTPRSRTARWIRRARAPRRDGVTRPRAAAPSRYRDEQALRRLRHHATGVSDLLRRGGARSDRHRSHRALVLTAGSRSDDARGGACSRRLDSRSRSAIAATNRCGLVEVQRAQRADDFATESQLADGFLHWSTVAQRSWCLHASITRSGSGRTHREMSPEKPRVTTSLPSTRTPTR